MGFSISLAVAVFACAFAAALCGSIIRGRLPRHHITREALDAINQILALIATIAAVVFGMLISSAQESHIQRQGQMSAIAAEYVELDRLLLVYGAETRNVRVVLRTVLERVVDVIEEPKHPGRRAKLGGEAAALIAAIDRLQPQTDAQRFVKTKAFEVTASLRGRRALFEESAGASTSSLVMFILVSWVTLLFFGFGIFVRANPTVLTAFFIGALTLSSAIFLIRELDRSDNIASPLREATNQLFKEAS